MKYYGNQLHYPLDSDLSGGYRYPPLEQLGPGEIHLADKSGKGLNSVSGEIETVECLLVQCIIILYTEY